ncbi:MAG TPA: tetratricopeptide repeat protein [Chroococcales cyanobacterium]
MEQERNLEDHYEVLQVHPKASPIVIKKAYRALLLELGNHPDRGGSPERARLLNEAYRILSDEKKREAYDSQLHEKKGHPLYMVACPRCGVFNRLTSEERIPTAHCGRCGFLLSTPPARWKRFWLVCGLIGLLALTSAGSFFLGRSTREEEKQDQNLKKAVHPPSDFASLVSLADLLIHRDQFTKAIPLYRKALSLQPQNPQMVFSLGLAYQMDRQTEQAIKAYKQTLALDGQHRQALLNLGSLTRDQGKMEEALALFQKASALRDEDPEPHFQIGDIQRGMGHSLEAVREFHACLERARENPILSERARRALRGMGAE